MLRRQEAVTVVNATLESLEKRLPHDLVVNVLQFSHAQWLIGESPSEQALDISSISRQHSHDPERAVLSHTSSFGRALMRHFTEPLLTSSGELHKAPRQYSV